MKEEYVYMNNNKVARVPLVPHQATPATRGKSNFVRRCGR